ncbi:unnamed protein product [Somion occarium]|uniref:C2H2-type domain-containing protein n=1 Tax=Somion occarium TaxID=3059160 RepID=A0ABP1E7K9_9APHY
MSHELPIYFRNDCIAPWEPTYREDLIIGHQNLIDSQEELAYQLDYISQDSPFTTPPESQEEGHEDKEAFLIQFEEKAREAFANVRSQLDSAEGSSYNIDGVEILHQIPPPTCPSKDGQQVPATTGSQNLVSGNTTTQDAQDDFDYSEWLKDMDSDVDEVACVSQDEHSFEFAIEKVNSVADPVSRSSSSSSSITSSGSSSMPVTPPDEDKLPLLSIASSHLQRPFLYLRIPSPETEAKQKEEREYFRSVLSGSIKTPTSVAHPRIGGVSQIDLTPGGSSRRAYNHPSSFSNTRRHPPTPQQSLSAVTQGADRRVKKFLFDGGSYMPSAATSPTSPSPSASSIVPTSNTTPTARAVLPPRSRPSASTKPPSARPSASTSRLPAQSLVRKPSVRPKKRKATEEPEEKPAKQRRSAVPRKAGALYCLDKGCPYEQEEKPFDQSRDRNRHMDRHFGKRFECPRCGDRRARKELSRKHLCKAGETEQGKDADSPVVVHPSAWTVSWPARLKTPPADDPLYRYYTRSMKEGDYDNESDDDSEE